MLTDFTVYVTTLFWLPLKQQLFTFTEHKAEKFEKFSGFQGQIFTHVTD